MSEWFEKYKYLMRQTRYLSVVATALMLVCVAQTEYQVYSTSLLSEDYAQQFAVREFVLLSLIVVAFSARILVLVVWPQWPYVRLFATWVLVLGVAGLYVWVHWPASECVSEAGKVCFTLRDASSVMDWVHAYAVSMPFASAGRSAIAGIAALSENVYK